MSTPWDADTYDVSSQPQQAWAGDVLGRLTGIAPDATVLDVGCGTGRVTEQLLELVPRGRVLAFDASADMVELARARLGDRAEVWCQDVLSLELPEPVDVVVSNAVLHWVRDHPRMWLALGAATTRRAPPTRLPSASRSGRGVRVLASATRAGRAQAGARVRAPRRRRDRWAAPAASSGSR